MTSFAAPTAPTAPTGSPRVAGDAPGRGWSTSTVGLVAAGSIALAAAVAEVGGTDEGVSICMVRHLTGGYCPGCGATRAARHLLHGDVGAAWRDHPWVLFAVAQVVLLGAVFAVVSARGRPRIATSSWLHAVGLVNVVALLAIWTARLATGAIPSPF